jgi:hypothetical protein
MFHRRDAKVAEIVRRCHLSLPAGKRKHLRVKRAAAEPCVGALDPARGAC